MATRMKQSHQLFLQTFMSRGILNATDVFNLHKKAKEIYNEVIVEEDQRQELIDFVGVINTNVKAFGMEIKKGMDEVNGSGYYCLVNTTESSITRCASQYTESELEFLKKMIEMIVTSSTGVIGSIAAVNITDSMTKKMSKADADYFLEKLHASKWLDKTDTGKLYLSTRGVLELEQYILDMYPDAAFRCNMCKKLAIQGETCGECGTKLHNYCSEKYFKGQTEGKCPQCRSPWVSNSTPVQPSTSGTTGSQTRKRKSKSDENGEELVYQREQPRRR